METSTPAYRLCINKDCKRSPDDNEPRDKWYKCKICDGYFTMKDMNYILFIQEEPNCYDLINRKANCNLCGNVYGLSQNKITGEYICMDRCLNGK